MRILIWHVHGGWMESFVQGGHEYLLPATPEGGPWGLGRGGRKWPDSAREVAPDGLGEEDIDVVVLQRPEEVDLCRQLTGRQPGQDVPAVYLEHNTPRSAVPDSVHPLADQTRIPVVHVTHFNRLFWDCGRAPTKVIEHGISDPGPLYSGERASLGVVINEPVRRWRVTGTDLLPRFAGAGALEAFGMGTASLPAATGLGPDRLGVHGDLPPGELHRTLASCRAYLHPARWTSLGLSLLEAMHLAMPVVVLGTTEAADALTPECGAVSTDVDVLVREATRLLADPEEARRRGAAARETALARYGLGRFLGDWDILLGDVAARRMGEPSKEGNRA